MRRRSRTVNCAIASAVLAGAMLAVGGCGSSDEPSGSATSTPSSPPSEPALSRLVGEWRRVNSCEAFVRAFAEAGLEDLAPEWLVGGGYFQRRRDIDDARPCRGATEVEHSHFFTEDGRFGSYDQNGDEVDHGDYTILDDTTLTFPTHAKEFSGDITVRYRVQEDTLDFEVVAPDPCTGGCRLSTAWAISAFYPGAFERSG
jgi:hypothetical protein